MEYCHYFGFAMVVVVAYVRKIPNITKAESTPARGAVKYLLLLVIPGDGRQLNAEDQLEDVQKSIRVYTEFEKDNKFGCGRSS